MHCCSGRMDIAQKSLQVSNRRYTSYRSQGLWRIQEGFQNFYHKSIIDWLSDSVHRGMRKVFENLDKRCYSSRIRC